MKRASWYEIHYDRRRYYNWGLSDVRVGLYQHEPICSRMCQYRCLWNWRSPIFSGHLKQGSTWIFLIRLVRHFRNVFIIERRQYLHRFRVLCDDLVLTRKYDFDKLVDEGRSEEDLHGEILDDTKTGLDF